MEPSIRIELTNYGLLDYLNHLIARGLKKNKQNKTKSN